MRFSSLRSLSIASRVRLACAAICAGALVGAFIVHPGAPGSFAASSTPPPPPSFVPTPIGSPPGPPTPSPVPGAASTATPMASPSPTKGATLDFSLDAARVSKVNNPGNLRGLVRVRPGSHIWLMMYYSVRNLPKKSTRVTTYTVWFGKRVLYKVAYKGSEKQGQVGRYSRYTVYNVPANLPFGAYVYRATLTIGHRSQSKSWKFSLGSHNQEISASH